MEIEVLLSCSQDPATGLSPEPEDVTFHSKVFFFLQWGTYSPSLPKWRTTDNLTADHIRNGRPKFNSQQRQRYFTIWMKVIYIAIDFQLCFKIRHYNDPTKSVLIGMKWKKFSICTVWMVLICWVKFIHSSEKHRLCYTVAMNSNRGLLGCDSV
jgi:hypothetical protein